MARELLDRLRFSRREVDEVSAAVLHHMQYLEVLRMRRATRRRLLLRPTYPLEIELHRLDCLGSNGRLDNYECLRQEEEALAHQPALIPPLLRGDDLLALGLPPGPALGRLLTELRDRQLEGELRTREEALTWAREAIRARGLEAPNGDRKENTTLLGTDPLG